MRWNYGSVNLKYDEFSKIKRIFNLRSTSECYSSNDASPKSWTVLPKLVSTIVFYIKDLNSGKEYLYGVGKDKIGYVRSDDSGIIWKIISKREFDTVNTFFNDYKSK